MGSKSLFLKSPPALLLASTSAYRRELLARLRIPFSVLGPGIDETPRAGEPALDLVRRLARAKALCIAARNPGAWVIGSDQAAVLEDPAGGERILGKPGSVARCIEQLQASSGRVVSFLTATALVRQPDSQGMEPQVHDFVDTTRVQFRTLGAAEIERYVALEAPLDCAGGFKSEGLGIALFEAVESRDPTALIGLPLMRLAAALREVGFEVP